MFRLLLTMLMLLSATAFGQGASDPMLRAEVEELQTVVRALRDNNARLQGQLDQQSSELLLLRREREQLIRKLADCREGSTSARVTAPTAAVAPAPPPVNPTEAGFVVEYVNATHHYVTLKAGTRQGVDLKQQGRVLRDGSVIAKVTVVHVLPSQSVADIDSDSLSGVYPRNGDLVVIP